MLYVLCLDINSCIGSRMTHNCKSKQIYTALQSTVKKAVNIQSFITLFFIRAHNIVMYRFPQFLHAPYIELTSMKKEQSRVKIKGYNDG